MGRYDHYWWPSDARGVGAVVLMLFGSYGVGAFVGLMTLLVLVLPLTALLRPRELLEGTDLSREEDHREGNLQAVPLVFSALAAATLATLLGVAGLATPLVLLLALVTFGLFVAAASVARRRPRRRHPS